MDTCSLARYIRDTRLRYRVSIDVHGYMFTSPLYTGHKIDLGTYISGAGPRRLALNSDSDRLDE
jgi:hypothetical protein